MSKTVLITGASRGIGKSAAELFYKKFPDILAFFLIVEYNKDIPIRSVKGYENGEREKTKCRLGVFKSVAQTLFHHGVFGYGAGLVCHPDCRHDFGADCRLDRG